MGGRGRFSYLSSRAALVGAGAAASALCGILGLAAAVLTGRPPVAVLAFSVAVLVVSVAVAWVWVIVPYRRTEQAVREFLDGYIPYKEVAAEHCRLSPGMERLFTQAGVLLDPSQLFQMNKRQAQYLALQNQINPHFLYNTLESIRSEALIAQLDSVADMTEALASFFRYTISKVENLVSVEEELHNCQTYFRIQQYRFGDRLRLKVEYDPEDRAEIFSCRLPKLTMQPILENSIIHGTELKIGTGNLTIHLERTARRLLIRVSDDGIGMDEETLNRLNGKLNQGVLSAVRSDVEQRGGVALVNVNNRIRLLFGQEYGLHVFSLPGAGTDVEITLPAITSDRDIPNQEALS